MRFVNPFRYAGALAALALALMGTACGSGDGRDAADPGTALDPGPDPTGDRVQADAPATDDGTPFDAAPQDPGLDSEGDPGGADPGSGDDPGPQADLPATDPLPAEDAPADTGRDPWPPTEPWWGVKQCLLPPCDPEATGDVVDLSGLWTRTLTAVSHDCNPGVEAFRPDIKPGAVTTDADLAFSVQGTCVHDATGGAVTGVVRGDTMITCVVQPPSGPLAPTSMPTSWTTFNGDAAVGESTVFLYGIPMLQPADCAVRYDVAYTRQ